MRLYQGLLIAFSTYSRLIVPRADWSQENRRYAMCFFPLIGAVIGALLWGWFALCDFLRLSDLLRGAVGAAIPLLISGGIHMDGFMDTCDALGSHKGREEKLAILRDSHAGAFAVMGCCLYLLIYAALLGTARSAPALALGYVLSRALSGLALLHMKGARPGGLLDAFASAADARRVTICLVGYVVLVAAGYFALAGPICAPICLGLSGAVFLAYRAMAYRQFGGLTGDLAGWFLLLCELAVALGAALCG